MTIMTYGVKSIEALCELAERKAETMTRGRRNVIAQKARCARELAPEFSIGQTGICPGMVILRTVGKNLGSYRWKDVRQVLDEVVIKTCGEKLLIGTSGERVTPDSIICAEVK